jgi:hypothetical protein
VGISRNEWEIQEMIKLIQLILDSILEIGPWSFPRMSLDSYACSQNRGSLDQTGAPVNRPNLIRRHNDRYQNQCRYYFMETLAFSNEMMEWTLYGRTRALHHMNWFTGPVPPDADWYETRMRTYDWQTDEIETMTQTN